MDIKFCRLLKQKSALFIHSRCFQPFQVSLSVRLTLYVADFKLTFLPLLVSVHFNLTKNERGIIVSIGDFMDKTSRISS